MRHRKSENWDVDIFSGFSHFTTLIYLKEICTRDDYILEKPLLLGVVNGEYRLRNISEHANYLISAAGFGYVLNYLTLDGRCLRTKTLVDRVDVKVFNKDGLMLVQSLWPICYSKRYSIVWRGLVFFGKCLFHVHNQNVNWERPRLISIRLILLLELNTWSL